MNKRLYRDTQNGNIGGVCAGLADYFNLDVTLIRALFLVALIGFGSGFVLYLILWVVIPDKKSENQNYDTDYTIKSDDMNTKKNKREKDNVIGGLVLITMGLIFLADEFIPWFSFGKLWPLIFVAIGVGLLWNNYSGKKDKVNDNNSSSL